MTTPAVVSCRVPLLVSAGTAGPLSAWSLRVTSSICASAGRERFTWNPSTLASPSVSSPPCLRIWRLAPIDGWVSPPSCAVRITDRSGVPPWVRPLLRVSRETRAAPAAALLWRAAEPHGIRIEAIANCASFNGEWLSPDRWLAEHDCRHGRRSCSVAVSQA